MNLQTQHNKMCFLLTIIPNLYMHSEYKGECNIFCCVIIYNRFLQVSLEQLVQSKLSTLSRTG